MMSPDRGSGRHIWIFTSWQWAVLGAYVVAIVLSAATGILAQKAVSNTHRIDRAVCAEIHYLESVREVAGPAASHPINKLILDLRGMEPNCSRRP